MPRAKYDPNNPYNHVFFSIGKFKVNYSDFLYDLRYIYQQIIDFYGRDLNDYYGKVCKRLDIVSQANVKPVLKNRLYIVTNLYEVVLAVVNIDDCVFDNIVQKFHSAYLDDACIVPDKINASYVTNLYMFKGDGLVAQHSVTTRKLAEFLMVFKKENIVNYQDARDTWYAEPRRRAKQQFKENV